MKLCRDASQRTTGGILNKQHGPTLVAGPTGPTCSMHVGSE